MIAVREISKSYGRVHAVRGVTFDLGAHQVAGLLGPNGAGKTTTIRMITGVLPPDSGSIHVAGIDAQAHPARARQQIGYLPESAPLYPEMTPEAYLGYRARLFDVPRRARRAAVDRVIERCRLEAMRRRRIGALSKGYRQRVGLASALLHDPPVIVLDEPTNGLDPSQILQARSLIRELAQDRTMLLCTHILPEVERTCDRVIIMGAGRILADGTPTALTTGPGAPHRYRLEVRDPAGPAHAAAVLAAPGGVASAAPAPAQPGDAAEGWAAVSVEAHPGASDQREALAAAAAEAGLFVRELARERQTLESLFVRLIDQAGGAAA